MTVHDPDAFRASLGARLANHAREIGYDVNRLRRHLVFQRVLARLAPSDRWVRFEFEIRRAREIAPADDQNDAVRFSVRARLGGREFASVVIDAVARPDELATAVSPIVVPPPVLAPGIEPISIPAVDVAQHAAEKFHPLARRYADDRLGERLRAVYQARDARPVPTSLPDPPAAWRISYAAMATELGLGSTELDEALTRVRRLYDNAVSVA